MTFQPQYCVPGLQGISKYISKMPEKISDQSIEFGPEPHPPLFVKMGKFVNYDFWASTLQASYLHLYCSKFKKLHEVWKGFFKGYNLSLTATF